MNQPWECPRCRRINAPFNPACFCNPENEQKKETETFEKTSSKAETLSSRSLGYRRYGECMYCGGLHVLGQACDQLKIE